MVATTQTPPVPAVYETIRRVQARLAVEGISKDRRNETQGFKFRGVDDCMNAIASIIAEEGLCILPRYVSRQTQDRQSAKGATLIYTAVEAEFDLVAASDASRHTIRTYGEAMDTGDKSCNKAMSAAYKYAILQAFSVPTEGDHDADATTHEVKPAVPAPSPSPAPPAQTEGDLVKPAVAVREVRTKTGTTKDGKPWTLYRVLFADGSDGGTFSATLGKLAAQAQQTGELCTATLRPNAKGTGYDLVDLRLVETDDDPPF